MFDVTVIIVNHNHGNLIKETINSLFRLKDRNCFKLIVVDNASVDGVSAWLLENYPQVHVIRNTEPKGFAYNNNLAIRNSPKCKYYILMNPDIKCKPGLLDNLVSFMESNKSVGIAGPRLLNLDGSYQFSARSFPNLIALLIRGLQLDPFFNKAPLLRNYLLMDIDLSKESEVDWVTGALVIVRPESIMDVGLLDESFYLYFEDEDWCYRMWEKGWKVCFTPFIEAVHLHKREGVRKPWSKAGRYHLKSAITMFKKHGFFLRRPQIIEKTAFIR